MRYNRPNHNDQPQVMKNPIPQARQLLASGQFEAAHRLLSKAARKHSHPDLHLLLSVAAGHLGRFEEVVKSCRQVLKAAPDQPAARMNLANALAALGRHEEAIAEYRRLLKRNPRDASLHVNLGHALYLASRHDEAVEALKEAIRLQPHHALAHHNLALALQASGDRKGAIRHYRLALDTDPELYESRLNLALCHLEALELEAAEQAFEAAAKLRPRAPEPLIGLARTLRYLGRLDDALACCERALELEPGNAEATSYQADLLEKAGQAEAALARVDDLIRRGAMTATAADAFTRLCRKAGRCEEAVAIAESLLDGGGLSQADRRLLHFALANLLDKRGEYDAAFAHLRQANDSLGYRFDAQETAAFFDRLIQVFARADLPVSTLDGDRLVFIVGMPRSGTSLTEQILAAHPSVFGAGEQPLVAGIAKILAREAGQPYPEAVRTLSPEALTRAARHYVDRLRALSPEAAQADFLTDKMPHNFQHIGLIARLFPKARIVHCVRDPRDTCLSIYFQQFAPSHAYSARLEDLGCYYRLYRLLMAHWEREAPLPIHRVVYEDLIAEPEAQVRRLLEFVGLPWDDRCLEFHKARRFVATASYDQVRQKLYSRSVARWRHYEHHLQPLFDALGDVSDAGSSVPPQEATPT